MKKNITKILAGICLSSTLFMTTGCIEETFPTGSATEDQLTSSSMATSAMLWAIPGSLNVPGRISSDYHWDWGYGSIIHIRDVMTEDMAVVSSGYDWYQSWEMNQNQGESYVYPQFIWNSYWQSMLPVNKLIGATNLETATEAQVGYVAAARAFRAMLYIDMARMFEFLPNDKTQGANVEGLTVPIVTEATTEADARNNPRVTREEMKEFILADLDFAEANIEKSYVQGKPMSKTLPDLAAVYGLKARCYMWVEDYANARDYARKAIAASGLLPMTEDQCLSTSKGFNDINCWIWGSKMVSEDDVVKTSLLNWTSWMSNETAFGYSGHGPFIMIGKSLYDRLSDTDFRKKMWKAPQGGMLEGEEPFISGYENVLPEYASIKFRPAEGNTEDFNVGAASAYPLMRVEEMFFIEMEAAAQLGDAKALSLLTGFMTTYRDPEYAFAGTGEKLIEEIIFQKRIELWGEGQTFFDVKRLNMSVTRGYEGTNFSDAVRFNTNGRPAWMNICIVQTEKNNNEALRGYENPDPSDKYEAWIDPNAQN